MIAFLEMRMAGTPSRVAFRLAGFVVSAMVVLAVAATPAPAATIVVDSTDDHATSIVVDGNCTLREAIGSIGGAGKDDCESGADPAVDLITFDDLGPGQHLIDANGGFIINSPVTIDASGLAGEVRIDGDGAPGPSQPDHGLLPRADGIVLKGLTVTRWNQTGVKIDIETSGPPPADGVQVLDSNIGTDEAGSPGLGNGSSGIAVGLDNGDPDYQPDNTVIRGNVISGNSNGVIVAGEETDNTLIAENLIGTGPTGTAALANGGIGVRVLGGADSTTIGGPATGDGNLISGNGTNAVEISAVTTDDISGTTIRNNLIGLGTDGSTAIGNGGIGVALNGSVDNTAVTGNSISSNAGAGVQLVDNAAGGVDSTTITGNRIGTDQAGNTLRANSEAIILTAPEGQGITNTTIGGPGSLVGNCSDPCNVIAGGRILVNSPTVTNTDILGNHVGVDGAGTSVLNDPVPENRIELNFGDDTTVGTPAGPNLIGGGNNAVKVDFSYTGEASIRSNLIGIGDGGAPDLGANNAGVLIQGADGVVVGGTQDGDGNEIANNGTGIQIDNGGTDNPIMGNSIHDNGGLGIDLFGVGAGVTPNDVGDVDTGSNDLQNYPEIEVVAGGQLTRILGRFMSTNAALFRLEFFASAQADDSGFGEGRRFLGAAAVTGTGTNSAFDVSLPSPTAPGEVVTATATRIVAGTPESTSEFSAALEVDSCGVAAQAVGAVVGTPQADSLTGTPGDDVICGGLGDDVIAPGEGNDVLLGGPGTDVVDHSTATSPVTVSLAEGASTGQGNNFLRGIEGVTGSGLPDNLIGSDSADIINGGGGGDLISAAGGNDTIDGGEGADDISASAGSDTVDGGKGNDRVDAGAGKDRVKGGGGKDTVRGRDGKDRLDGGAGRDRLVGDGGNDRLLGGAGRDNLSGGDGKDVLNAGAGSRDRARGGAGRDVLKGGAGRKDICDGGAGKDRAKRSCEKKKRIP